MHTLGRGRIQSAEILEHESALLRGQAHELFPSGVAQPRARAGDARFQHVGDADAVTRRGTAGAFLLLVGLAPRKGAACVEQAPVQALLPLDGLLVETARLELARQLARLLGERSGRAARSLGLEPLELFGERPLP